MSERSKKISRRDFCLTAGAGAMFAATAIAGKPFSNKDMLVYVGTYTSSGALGVYSLRFDASNGTLTDPRTVKGIVDPSFLTIDNKQRYLYAVNETLEFNRKPSGGVSAFSIDQKDGSIKFIDQVASMGGAPCNIILTRNGKFALVANYLGGNVAVFPVRDDGGLGESVSVAQHSGKGPNKDRQEAAHAHSITLDRDERYAIAADLGIDKLLIYKFDEKTGKLTAHSSYEAAPGAGPRHFTFHPNGKHAYLINELDSTVSALAYSSGKGELEHLETISTLPPNFTGTNSGADIHVSPSGNFLYASNRGHDSIVVYSIDPGSGKIAFVGHTPTGGKTPRNFAIDPTGKFLLAANQGSGSITVFSIDRDTGKLTSTGNKIDIPAPVCLKLIPSFS
jgi:6-phosphogluconolactonase